MGAWQFDAVAGRTFADADPLRVVCAWCKKTMSDGREPTSHGMCAKCSTWIEKKERAS